MVKIALGVRSPGFTYEELFPFAKAAHFDGIHYIARMKDFLIPPIDIFKLSIKNNIPVIGIHQPLHTIVFIPQILFENMLSIQKLFPEVTDYVVHLSAFKNILQNDEISKIFYAFGKKKNITVSFESNPAHVILQYYAKETYDPHLFGEYCKNHKFPIVMDTSHIASMGGDIIYFYKQYKKLIRIIHLSDFKNGKEHLPLGNGSLPIHQFLKEVKQSKKQPDIVFEINHMFEKSSKEELLEEIKNSLELVRKILN